MEIDFVFLQLFIIAAVFAGAEIGFATARRAWKKINKDEMDSHLRVIRTIESANDYNRKLKDQAEEQIIKLQSDLADLKTAYINTVEDLKIAQARANHRKLPK